MKALKGGEKMARKKNTSLAYQIRSAINANFKEGSSKRAAKMCENGTGAKVYSYSHRKSLIELGTQLAHFCRDNYNIKFVKDINRDHVDAFLKDKAKTCADTTLKTYFTNIKKLNKVVNSTYSTSKHDWTKGVIQPTGVRQTKLRDAKIEREDMNKVLKSLNLSYATHRAIVLAEGFGLRANETTKLRGDHIDIKKGHITIQGKGGKIRTIPIKEEHKELMAQFKEEFADSRVAEVKTDSVNVTFKRLCEKNGIDYLQDKKTGIHAIRKLYATEMYEEKLEQGYSEKDAWGDVSETLGHGRDRHDLFTRYVIR